MNESSTKSDISPRLIVDEADKAIAFYLAVFDAKLLGRFTGPNGVVVHAAIQIGQATFSIAEQVPNWKLFSPTAIGGSAVLIHITLRDPDETATLMVEHGSEVVVAIEDRPYGMREGRIRDPFGHLWILSRPTEALSDAEIQKRLNS